MNSSFWRYKIINESTQIYQSTINLLEQCNDDDNIIFRPDLLDWRQVERRDVRERIDLAFHIMDREYGVTRLLDPEGELVIHMIIFICLQLHNDSCDKNLRCCSKYFDKCCWFLSGWGYWNVFVISWYGEGWSRAGRGGLRHDCVHLNCAKYFYNIVITGDAEYGSDN